MSCLKIMASSTLVSYMIFSMAIWTASAAASFTCPMEGIFPDPTNCHNFYICDKNLLSSPGTCMNGKGSFEVDSQTCSVTPCSGPASLPAFSCPKVGLYIDPTNCTNFYSCDQDLNPIPGSCLAGTGSFDNVTKTCSASHCFNCASPGFFADPYDCHSFYVCSDKLVATHSTCTSAGYFDPTRICVIGACTTTQPAEFKCTSIGYFADPKDCRSYYLCDSSLNAHHGICQGGGGYFDKEEQGCVAGKCTN